MTKAVSRLAGAMMLAVCALPLRAEDVTVFAAASLKTALDAVAGICEADTGDRLTISYAGSSALARQIAQGAPAGVFISANTDWMDRLEQDGLLAGGTRRDLLTNRLVLIAAPGVETRLDIVPGFDLAGALGDRKLAMALVGAVPAGIYGREALTYLGVWDAVEPKVAQADNVRAALRLVAQGEAPFGIVYATDAIAEPAVRVVAAFPADSHAPIVYPAAVVKDGDSDAARNALACLESPRAREVFGRNGFGVSTGGGS